MANDVIGLFRTHDEAGQAAQALERAGFSRGDIRVESYGPEDGLGTEAKAENGWLRILEWLHLIAPKPDADFYSQGVRRGETLVSVTAASDAAADSAVDILNRCGALNLDERTAPFGAPPPPASDSLPPAYPLGQNRPSDTQVMDAAAVARLIGADAPPPEEGEPAVPGQVSPVSPEIVTPIVGEQSSVGTQSVGRGSARVYRHTVERPVEREVSLREERVTVERHAASRAATDDDGAFRESVWEWSETEEQAVVSKTARVVEEVVVGKTVTRHTETIRDTVRRSEVEVEPPPARRGEAR